MNDIIYMGPFKDHIQDYVKLKQSIGYKYHTEATHLKRFDKFILEKYPDATVLTKEIVLDWCSKKTYETQTNQCCRTSVIRQLGRYLASIEVYAYIIPKRYYSSARQYTPHIYTIDELSRFFVQTDQCQYCYECPYRHLIMPIIFRMVYLCGLRISEARFLKVADVILVP